MLRKFVSSVRHFYRLQHTESFIGLKSFDSVETYPGHIKTSPLQKYLLSFGSGIGCLLNPKRADLLSTFGETSGEPALRKIHHQMLNHPNGCRILSDRPIIRTNTVDLDALRKLPDGTFGKAYTNFLDKYRYSPDERHYVRFVDDPDLAYVMLRYREIHDLVHTLLGQPTDMLGEVVVKWVEGIQTLLPMCLTGGYFGSLRLAPKQTENYLRNHLEYAIRTGKDGSFLMCVYFEEHWEDNMEDFRSSLNIQPPPPRQVC
ncbi:Ubiquinone biosynthesis protein COQ4 like, mitochondrial [Schistosoma japonicum]|nr:Ubiquinone biosynthesis protein COQ4 like, mitochondrial [Schistosoma japonicum]KAH8859232.1 Ubiquinone biosynthesis protein COQ4 like, mitochondrial [Schistosoma japonicum]